MKPRAHPAPAKAGQVRLIGGRWRGSKLPVPALPGLRPTSDRVRETLFNWLQAEVAGARVLDLFAGSGALGFEAASRGAARVDLVESAPAAVAALRETVARLGRDAPGGAIEVQARSATDFLAEAAVRRQVWDLAFVDPPFDGGLWDAALAALAPCLAARAHVYVESAVGAAVRVPAGWSTHRELVTREARATLYRVGTG